MPNKSDKLTNVFNGATITSRILSRSIMQSKKYCETNKRDFYFKSKVEVKRNKHRAKTIAEA